MLTAFYGGMPLACLKQTVQSCFGCIISTCGTFSYRLYSLSSGEPFLRLLVSNVKCVTGLEECDYSHYASVYISPNATHVWKKTASVSYTVTILAQDNNLVLQCKYKAQMPPAYQKKKHLFVPLYLIWVVQDHPSQQDCKAFNSASAHNGSPGSATEAQHQTVIIKNPFCLSCQTCLPEKNSFFCLLCVYRFTWLSSAP